MENQNDIILLAKNGDRKAIEILCHNYKPLILSLITRMKIDRQYHQDCIQEGMIGLLKALKSYEFNPGYTFGTFVRRQVKDCLLVFRLNNILIPLPKNRYKDKPMVIKELLNTINILTDEDVEQLASTQEEKDKFQSGISSLDEFSRFLIMSKYGLGVYYPLPYKQLIIAVNDKYGISLSIGQLRYRIRKIFGILKKKLKEE